MLAPRRIDTWRNAFVTCVGSERRSGRGSGKRTLPCCPSRHMRWRPKSALSKARLLSRSKLPCLHLVACFEDGTKFLEAVNRPHLEGIVSKRKASPYRADQSRDWRKIKATTWREATGGGCSNRELRPDLLSRRLLQRLGVDRHLAQALAG